MMLKAHPPHTAGGSGNAQEQRKYFSTCVARGGKMEDLGAATEGRDK
jgi:hypothetical protein